MLTNLTVKNFGLIDQLALEFHPKLNVITGETGAGKSIAIGALRCALGERFDVSQLRVADHPCVIEAVFDLGKNKLYKLDVLADYLDSEDPETLIISRTVTPDGKNKIKVNGQMLNVGQLKEIGNFLMDFHGPHDHQMLLASESHIGLLDQLCDFGDCVKNYQASHKEYSEVKAKLEVISQLGKTRERELDLLKHQIKELEQVSLEKEKYEEISQKKVKVDNSQKLNESVMTILDSLDEGERSSGELIRQSFSAMKQLNRLDEHTVKFMEDLNTLQETHESLVVNLKEYATSLEFDQEEAKDVETKNDCYDDILRKYGPTIDESKKFYLEAKEKFNLLANLDENNQDLQEQIKILESKLGKEAQLISKERQKKANNLKKTIESELKELGIAHVLFEAKLTKKDFAENGADFVEFYISPNAGEELKPMAEIVSSGEAARVMLALKKALIAVDPIPVLVFDEIDAQIGGRLGTITGEKLRDISKYRQVILITHLPQIASFGDSHHKVIKSVKNSRTVTEVIPLNDKERVVELAQMMSGQKETDVSIKHAKDMLKAAGK